MDGRKTLLVAIVGLALAAATSRTVGQTASPSPAPANSQAPGQSSANPHAAQNPHTTPHSAAQPLRATTRLVQVSVVVHDKHGDPITGLTKDDFVILDNKKPQAIQLFSVQTNQFVNAPLHELPPDTYTNRMEARGGAPSNVSVILLDALNTSFMDRAFVRNRLVKYLRTVQPQDRVALYALGTHLQVLHDFTSDASSLLASFEAYKDEIGPEIDESHFDRLGLASKKLRGTSSASYRAEKTLNTVQTTMEVLREIADHLGALPGRKNLIWISGGFPFSIRADNLQRNSYGERIVFATQIEIVARALSDANVAIYPVDARGLIDLGADAMLNGSAGNPFLVPDTDDFGTMQTLADRTGGRAFFNTNDIEGSVRQAVDDSRVTYELGFVPEGIKWDGSFHKIHVTVDRTDAHVRARKGYFALAEPKEAPLEHLVLIARTAISPVEATAIEMNVHVKPGHAVKGNTLKMEIAFDIGQLEFQQDNQGYWNATVDTAFVELDERGKMIASTLRPYPLCFDTATHDRFLKEGMAYSNVMLILPDAAMVRVILRDTSTGKIGSVNIPLAQYSPAKTN